MRNRTSSSSRAVDGRSLRAGQLLAGLQASEGEQRKSGNRRHESRRSFGLPEAIGSRVCSTLLSDLASRRRPCASLALHLHQAVKRTFTSKLSNMLGTQKKGPDAKM